MTPVHGSEIKKTAKVLQKVGTISASVHQSIDLQVGGAASGRGRRDETLQQRIQYLARTPNPPACSRQESTAQFNGLDNVPLVTGVALAEVKEIQVAKRNRLCVAGFRV